LSFHPAPDFYGDFAKVQENLLALDTAPFANIVETCHGFVVELEYSRESFLARINSDNAAFTSLREWTVAKATVDTTSYKVCYDYRWVAPTISAATAPSVAPLPSVKSGNKSRRYPTTL